MAFTPTALGGDPSKRYGYKFNAAWLWIATIASTAYVPTEAEINAAGSRDLTPGVQAVNGFNISPRYAELPDVRSQFDGKVPDGASLDDSSIVFYQANDDADALDFFTAGDDGYIIHCPRGLTGTPAPRANAWKVEVSAVISTTGISGGAMGTVSFAVLDMKSITMPTPT
jgi:hypothetical protein